MYFVGKVRRVEADANAQNDLQDALAISKSCLRICHATHFLTTHIEASWILLYCRIVLGDLPIMGKRQKENAAVIEQPNSLEQLKSLNSIPNLVDRLALATSLCNHGHRADMIYRWLTELISTDKSARSMPESWNLLTKAVRMLGFSRLSSLFRTRHLIKHVDQTLREQVGQKPDSTLLTAVKDLLEVLLTCKPATSLTSANLISLDVEEAASLYESLMLQAWSCMKSSDLQDNLHYLLAGTAIDIWNARRPSSLENDHFQKQCWYISALIHAQGSKSEDGLRAAKRKHSSQPQASDDVVASLERHMAKHVYLPSRTAFFAQQDETSRVVEPLLHDGPFATQSRSEPDQISWDILPTQLSIAIRCASINTYRQKLKETEWIDAVFTALLQLRVNYDGAETSEQILLEMLDKVMSRHKLSGTVVLQLVNDHCSLDSHPCKWPLVAKLLKMDGLLFTDHSLADRLFAAINRTEIAALGGNMTSLDQLKIDVLVPIANSFASSRQLNVFLTLWQRHMEQGILTARSDVWLGIEDCLEHILEQSLSIQQIQEEIATRVNDISKIVNIPKATADHEQPITSKFSAACVVLSAIFHGVRHNSDSNVIADQAGETVKILFHYAQAADHKTSSQWQMLTGAWSLVTEAFGLWFPVFALEQAQDTVNDKAVSLLKEPILDLACDFIVQQTQTNKLERVRQDRNAAKLVAFFCHTLQAYPGCTSRAQELVTRLVKPEGVHARSMLVAYPSLTSLLDRKIVDTALAGLQSVNSSSHEPSLKQLPVALSSTNKELVAVTIAQLLDAASADNSQTNVNVIGRLLEVPPRLFTREQRESLVNALTTSGQHNDVNANIVQLALLISHLGLPTTKTSCLDTTEFVQRFRDQITVKKLSSTELASIIDLSKTVTKLIYQRWSSNSPHARSKDCLENTLRDSLKVFGKKHLEKQRKKGLLKATIAAAFLQDATEVVIHGKRGIDLIDLSISTEDVIPQMNSAIEQFLDLDLAQIESQPIESALLTAYLTAAYAVAGTSGAEFRSSSQSFADLQKLAAKIMTKFTPESWSGDEDGTRTAVLDAPAVQAYRIICLDSRNELALLAHSACRLVSVPFSSNDRAAILAAYKQAAQQADVETRLAVTQGLINNTNTPLQASSFTIIEQTLSTISDTSGIQNSDLHSSGILASILKHVRDRTDFATIRPALQCVMHMLRHNSGLVNQFEIDLCMSAVHAMAKASAVEVLLYSDLCAVMTTLITHRRTRLSTLR